MEKLIDNPLGSLVVIDDTICEVVLDNNPLLLAGCKGCIFHDNICCAPSLRFECCGDQRSDGEWVFFRPIETD